LGGLYAEHGRWPSRRSRPGSAGPASHAISAGSQPQAA
jgi:hypothetical protein